MRFPRYSDKALLLFSIVVCGALRFSYLNHGLPELFEEAVPVRKAWGMWNWDAGAFDFNPHFFGYPSFYFYVQWLGQVAYLAIGIVVGWFQTSADLRIAYRLDISPFILLGRAISVGASLATIWGVFRLGQMLNVGKPVWAALIFGILPASVSLSRLILVDVPLTLFTILALVSMTGIVTHSTRRAHLVTGMWIGLAVSSKYTACVLLAPLAVASLLGSGNRNPLSLLRRSDLWLGGCAAALAFAVTSPYLVLELSVFWADFSYQLAHVSGGHFGRMESSISYYPTVLFQNFGLLLVAAASLGIAWIARLRNRRSWYPTLTFLVVYGVIIHSWAISFEHYLLPILPVLALVCSEGIWAASQWLAPRTRFGRGPVLLCAVLAQPASGSITRVWDSIQPTTRAEARQWIEEHLERDATIVCELLTVDLSPSGYKVVRIPMDHVFPEQTGPVYDLRWYEPFDYLITSDAISSRYLADPPSFPSHKQFYDALEREWTLSAEFRPKHRFGHTIRIYQNPAPSLATRYEEDLYGQLRGTMKNLVLTFLFSLEQTLRQDGRVNLSVNVCQHLVAFVPDDRKALLRLSQALITIGRNEDALGVLESVLDNDASNYVRGVVHSIRGDLDSAIVYWKLAADEGRASSVHHNLGLAYLQKGQRVKATEHFEKAVSFAPATPDSYLQLSQLYFQDGRTRDCESLLVDVLRQWPDNIRAHYGLGLALLRLNEPARAADALREVLVRRPDHAEATNRLGQLAYESGDMDSAIEIWQEGLLADSTNVQYYVNLGAAQQLKGDVQAALNTWYRGLTLDPGNEDLSVNIDQVLRARGDIEPTEPLLERP